MSNFQFTILIIAIVAPGVILAAIKGLFIISIIVGLIAGVILFLSGIYRVIAEFTSRHPTLSHHITITTIWTGAILSGLWYLVMSSFFIGAIIVQTYSFLFGIDLLNSLEHKTTYRVLVVIGILLGSVVTYLIMSRNVRNKLAKF